MIKKFKSILMALLYMLIYVVVQSVTALAVPIITFIKSFLKNTKDIDTLISEFYINIDRATKNLSFIIIMSALLSLAIYMAVIYLRKKRFKDFVKTKDLKFRHLIIAVMLTIGLNLIALFITSLDIFKNVMPEYQSTVSQLLNGNLLLTLLAVGIVAPAFEEIMYRGIILKELNFAFGFLWANILQALFFGLMHGNIVQGTYAAIIGFVLGLSYKKSGSIYFVILVHILFNVANVLMASLEVYLTLPSVLTLGVLGCFASLYLLNSNA